MAGTPAASQESKSPAGAKSRDMETGILCRPNRRKATMARNAVCRQQRYEHFWLNINSIFKNA